MSLHGSSTNLPSLSALPPQSCLLRSRQGRQSLPTPSELLPRLTAVPSAGLLPPTSRGNTLNGAHMRVHGVVLPKTFPNPQHLTHSFGWVGSASAEFLQVDLTGTCPAPQRCRARVRAILVVGFTISWPAAADSLREPELDPKTSKDSHRWTSEKISCTNR